MKEIFVGFIKEQFDRVVHRDDTIKIEVWYARELMGLLGYERWENFHKAIMRAMESCETGYYHATPVIYSLKMAILRRKKLHLLRVVLLCKTIVLFARCLDRGELSQKNYRLRRILKRLNDV